jgi:hypothetical protein
MGYLYPYLYSHSRLAKLRLGKNWVAPALKYIERIIFFNSFYVLRLKIKNKPKGDKVKKIRDYFNQFIVFSLIVFVTACNPAINNQELTPISLPSPTSTITPSPSITPIPQYNTDVPNHYDQNDNYGDGFKALILIKATNNLSSEDIVTKLVTTWLEHFKTTKSLTPRAMINDYKDVYVYKVIHDNNNYDGFFDIVAFVKFSIIPAQTPSDWANLLTDSITEEDLWWHMGTVFGFFRDGEYFRLRSMPGWGT